jgi:hypothetical protein
MSLRKNVRNQKSTIFVGMQRRIEIWRKGELIDVDEKLLDFEDLVVDAGLNALCGQAFDGSGSRPAVFNYVAIGTDGTAPANGQTALLAEVMRVQGTYAKDAALGECSMDATFNITATYALQECGLFNANSGGSMYCRDTYATKNVVSGDTVKASGACPRMRPKCIIQQSFRDPPKRRKYMSNMTHRSTKGNRWTRKKEKQTIRKRPRFHQKAVIEQAEVLRQQGFRVVITDKVRPDIIARRGDKIYAVEVEFNKPDYDKYEGVEVFDDIMWIVKYHSPKFQRST